MTTTQYGFSTMLRDVAFEDVVRRMTDALKNEDAAVAPVAEEAEKRLRRVVAALAGKESV